MIKELFFPGNALVFFTAARTCYCSEQKIFTQPDDHAALPAAFSKENFSCTTTIQCVREHYVTAQA
jgi:hypothetical protein